ncbi:MAG TPA: T9SS type A sorting domain-containing protein [Bacteroidales bacterium]|nr:T9SS type A sorting domain-containing protein [Bacteroidales bacterium]
MKLILRLLIFLCLTGHVLAQTSKPVDTDWYHKSPQLSGYVSLENCIWKVRFEENSPVWTFGQSQGSHSWQVSDTTPDNGFEYDTDGDGIKEPAPPLWVYMGKRYVNEYSESGHMFASIDAISNLLTDTPETFEAWIRFDNINLTALVHPKLSFYQNYKAFNGDKTYVDFSTNNGISWTSVEVNYDVNVSAYGEQFIQMVAPPATAGHNNVSIRFRMLTTDATLAGGGYGWQIDDVSFSELPEYDLKLCDNRVHYDWGSYDEETSPVPQIYHAFSYYGATSEDPTFGHEMFFSWIVKNQGYSEISPVCSIRVYQPNNTLIYSETIHGPSLLPGRSDTVFSSITPPLEFDYNSMVYFVFDVNTGSDNEINLSDNCDTARMNKTWYLAHDDDNINATISGSDFTSGHKTGEMFGNYFLLFHSIVGFIDVFIDTATSPGTSIKGHAFQTHDGNEWLDIAQTTFYPITDTCLGKWNRLFFSHTSNSINSQYYGAIIAIEFNYGDPDDNKNIKIGTDLSVHASSTGSFFYFTEGPVANQWHYMENWNYSGVGIRLMDRSGWTGGWPEYGAYICDGEYYEFHGQMLSEAGVYNCPYYPFCHLYLNVVESPTIVNLTGCFDEDTQTLEIGMNNSDPGRRYKLYCNYNGADTLMNDFLGTGQAMNLGTYYLDGNYRVLAKADAPECDRWMNGTVNFQVSAPALQSEPDFSFYPNPARDVLLIETSHTEFEVYITDMNGKELFHGQNTRSVNTGILAPGSYLVHLKTREHDSAQKFIVK